MQIRRAFGVLLIGAMVLVGCGDGDETADSDTDPSPGSTAVDSTAGGGNPVIDQARCNGAATAMAQAAAAVPQALQGTAAGVQSTADTLEGFSAAAPSEVREDLETVSEGYAAFAKVLADANYNPATGQPPSQETVEKLQDASEKLEDTEFLEAANRVQTWFQSGCPS